MKGSRLRWGMVALLLVLLVAALRWPSAWLAPGSTSPGHARIANDCFACHVAWGGARNARCTSCHEPASIGVRTSGGQMLPARRDHVPFHQGLARPDCLACHGGHGGAQGAVRTRFDHSLVRPDVAARCSGCHQAPDDSLHHLIDAGCGTCHGQSAWKPAHFDHAKYFVLDRDHQVACSTCHAGQRFSSYSCTGCHEHSPARLRAEHAEEGITRIDDCVRCHRSASEHGEGGKGGDDD